MTEFYALVALGGVLANAGMLVGLVVFQSRPLLGLLVGALGGTVAAALLAVAL